MVRMPVPLNWKLGTTITGLVYFWGGGLPCGCKCLNLGTEMAVNLVCAVAHVPKRKLHSHVLSNVELNQKDAGFQ